MSFDALAGETEVAGYVPGSWEGDAVRLGCIWSPDLHSSPVPVWTLYSPAGCTRVSSKPFR